MRSEGQIARQVPRPGSTDEVAHLEPPLTSNTRHHEVSLTLSRLTLNQHRCRVAMDDAWQREQALTPRKPM